MIWRRANRWRIRQWTRRQRKRLIATVLLFCVMALALAFGAFDTLDHTWSDTLYQLRGPRDSSQKVVVIEFEPREGETFAAGLDAVSRAISQSGADWTAVYVPASVGGDEAVICAPMTVWYGFERPTWLAEQCRWVALNETHRDHRGALLWDDQGQRDVTGFLTEHIVEVIRDRQITTNFSGGLPTITSENVRNPTDGVFAGRIAMIVPAVEGLRRPVTTPFGEAVDREVLRAEVIATVADDAQPWSPWPLKALLWVFAMWASWWAFERQRHALSAIVGIETALLAAQLFLFVFDVHVATIAPCILALGTFLIGRSIEADRKESGLDVQVRLAAAVRAASERRAYSLSGSPTFWPNLVDRIADRLGVLDAPPFGIAELPLESWWIAFRAFHAMDEKFIVERRRDIRREPYREAYETGNPTHASRYVGDDLETIFVPLRANERLVGFWTLNVADAAEYLEEHRAELVRLAPLIGDEIRSHQLESETPTLLSNPEKDVIDSALAAMEHMELDRRTLEDVIVNVDMGILTTNVFGEVVFENDTVRTLIASREDLENQPPVERVVAVFADERVGAVTDVLDSVLATGTEAVWRAPQTVDDPRVFEIRASRIAHKEGGRDIIRGLIITFTDITHAAEESLNIVDTLKDQGQRARALSTALSAYASVIAPHHNVDRAAKAALEGIRATVSELEQVTHDIDLLAQGKKPENSAALVPFTLQFAVRESMRAIQRSLDLGEVNVELPDTPVVAHAADGAVQQAIRLVVEEASAMVSESLNVTIRAEVDTRVAVIHVEIPAVAIPSGVLNRLLDASKDDPGRLATARKLIEAAGGDLVAEASMAEGLHFQIVLPRQD